MSGAAWIERGARSAALAWLACIGGALAAGAIGGAAAEAVASDGPTCPFRALTGVRCAMCGMTHATVALGGGDVGAALAHHALAPVLLALVIVMCARVVRGGTARLRDGRLLPALLVCLGVAWILNSKEGLS